MKTTILLKDLVLDPKNPVDVRTLTMEEIRERIVAAYSRIGDAVEVQVDADAVTISFPEDSGRLKEAEATFAEAVSKAQRGNVSEAVALHRKVLDYLPTHIPSRRNLALLLLEQGKTEEAADLLLDLVLLAPEDPWAFGVLGKHYAAKGDAPTAEVYLRKALAFDPADVPALINLAGVLVELGRTDEAGNLFLRVIEQASTLPNAYYGLAMIHVERNPKEARAHLDRMFEHADFSDRKHLELLRDAREMYLEPVPDSSVFLFEVNKNYT